MTGKYGDKYDAPNDFKLAIIINCKNIASPIPKKPAAYATVT